MRTRSRTSPRTLRRLKPAWNVVEISRERQTEKQARKRTAVAA